MNIFRIKEARTFMPDIIAPGTGLSPATKKSIIPTNNVTTIEDILNGAKYKLPGGGGDWSSGEDVSKNYKEDGDAYKRQERDIDMLKKMTTLSPDYKREEWSVRVPGGKRSFVSLNLAKEYERLMRQKGIPVKWTSRTKLAQTQPPNRVQLVAQTMEKTFMVESIDMQAGMKQNGAAFCVAPNMFITCAHVIKKYDKNTTKELIVADLTSTIQLSLINGEQKVSGKLVAINSLWDLALIQCEINVEPFIVDTNPMVGDDIFTIGSPHGFENNVSFGTIGSLDRTIYTYKDSPLYMFVDLAAFTGNSGGPIIKQSNGAIVGVLTAIVSATGEYGLNAGLQSSYVKNFLQTNGISV
jgi:hypothetical protein